MKRNLLIAITVIISLSLFGIGSLAYFFIANEAPMIKGDVIHHIHYKKGLSLDIYKPTQEIHKASPVVVFFHGGAWILGSKGTININRINGAINQLREKGYSIISVNYTLANKDHPPFPHCIVDAFDAIKWIEDHAEEFHFDINNVGLIGESAGAHIALMTAYANAEDFHPAAKSIIKIQYVVDIYGPSHLHSLYLAKRPDSLQSIVEKMPKKLKNRLEHQLFGFNPEEDSLQALRFSRKYSPITYVNTQVPPTLIIHGQLDKIVPLSQSQMLHEKLMSLKIANEMHIINQMHHAFNGATKEQKIEIQSWIVDFIEKHYHL